MDQIVFYLFGGFAVLGALGVPLLKNPVHSAMSLAGVFLSLAVLYVVLDAPFIAAAQVLIYMGAILVLFLFVTMVLSPQLDVGPGRLPGLRGIAILVGAALVVEIGFIFAGAQIAPARGLFSPEEIARQGHTQVIGQLLFTDFLLPFEITSGLILIAIVGALVLTRKIRERESKAS